MGDNKAAGNLLVFIAAMAWSTTGLLYDERVSMLTISGGVIMLAAAVLYLITDSNRQIRE